MIDQIEALVTDSVTRVFETMLNLKATVTPSPPDLWNGETHVAGSVGFIGRLSGVVYLYTSASFARRLTRVLLGLGENEVDGNEMVNDAVGELANMIVGQIKSQLSDRGMPCVLTIPSIVRGSHFVIEAVSSTTRRLVAFRCADQSFLVETLIKPS